MERLLSDPFAEALARLDKRIEREITKLRLRYQLSLDEFRGLYVSDQQVDNLIALASTPAQTDGTPIAVPELSEPLHRHERWARVASRFALSAIDEELLLLAMAPELHLRYETLFAYLNDDVTRKWPTTDLAIRLLANEGVSREAIAQALSPAATLRMEGLIDPIDPPGARPALLNAGFAVRPAISRYLQGIPSLSAEAPPDSIDEVWSGLPLSPDQRNELRRIGILVATRDGSAPAVVLVGHSGTGRTEAARALAWVAGRPMYTIDFGALRRAGASAAQAVTNTALQAKLEDSAVCARGLTSLIDTDGRVAPEFAGLLEPVSRTGAFLIVVAEPRTPWRALLGGRRVLLVELGVPEYDDRLRLWRSGLQQEGLAATEPEARAVADRFALTPGQIADSIATARDWLQMGVAPTATGEVLRDAARAQIRDRVSTLAPVVKCCHGWRDLVLPSSVLSRLKEMAAAIQQRHVVYGDWGFGRRLVGAMGVKVLFAGPSGTGKTMAATVVAREVGLDLVKIDLSCVVSKYIGETEKNLDSVFASARAGHALLFFDEADAIFGRRSEVKDAHDRYANIEVAYLLQKLDEHDGAVVLATNLRRNIDDAFSRRMHYVIDFPQPDASDRERLWRGMFPAEAPLDPDVDFPFLARQFELAGGDIRNIALDAAFLAATDGGRITMRHVVRGVAQHQSKQGRTPALADYQRYYPLIHATGVEAAARP